MSELLWCIKLSYFAENRWCPNINGVRKYMVNRVEYDGAKIYVVRNKVVNSHAVLHKAIVSISHINKMFNL